MSDLKRKKKDGENKDKKNIRMTRHMGDPKQNVDKPDVDRPLTDEFDQTLKNDSKRTKRGDSNQVK
jgi:hypothetical protein